MFSKAVFTENRVHDTMQGVSWRAFRVSRKEEVDLSHEPNA